MLSFIYLLKNSNLHLSCHLIDEDINAPLRVNQCGQGHHMSDGGEANNEIYMSRLCFIIVFTNGNILLNMWYISRCFKVDFSTEIIHHAFGILKIDQHCGPKVLSPPPVQPHFRASQASPPLFFCSFLFPEWSSSYLSGGLHPLFKPQLTHYLLSEAPLTSTETAFHLCLPCSDAVVSFYFYVFFQLVTF